MNNSNINEYPYGQFPTKFTKHGQKEYFEQLTNASNVSTLSTPTAMEEKQPQNNPSNNFDLSKMLPLLKLMGDKKSMSSSDMLQMLIPLLGGGNMSNLSEIMSLFNKEKPVEEVEEDIFNSDIKIDDYKRVE